MRSFIELLEDEGDFKVKKGQAHMKPVFQKSYSRYAPDKQVGEKVSHHDYVVHHHETGEPLFNAVKHAEPYSKSDGYRLTWHPYMTDLHPGLKDSFEHGPNHPLHDRPRYEYDPHGRGHGKPGSKAVHGDWTGNHKAYLPQAAKNIYDKAARSGFKDTLPHTFTDRETPDSYDPSKKKIERQYHFHDPETNEKIVSFRKPTIGEGGHGQSLHNVQYLAAHGIQPEVIRGSGKHGYDLALHLYKEKGESYHAVGTTTRPTTLKRYNIAPGKTAEEVSAAHEANVRETHGHRPGFQLTRHSPTAFAATTEPERDGYTGLHLASMAHGKELTSHEGAPTYVSDREKGVNSHKF